MDERTEKFDNKKDSGQQMENHYNSSESKLTEGPDISRRKFTRNVLVGSAVLLTLTNRSAWAAKVTPCISTNLLVSYTGRGSMLTTEQQQEVENYEHYLNNSDYRVIKEPEDINGDTCYEAVSSNGNIDNAETTLWFDEDPTNQ